MIKKNSKIYIAGHKGLVGSAICRKLKEKGYKNLITADRKKLNLLDQKLYESIRKQKYLTVLNHKDTHLYVDPLSEMYLLGTTIDYIHEDYSKGQFESKFNFDINKDLMSSCGCGISFSPKNSNP